MREVAFLRQLNQALDSQLPITLPMLSDRLQTLLPLISVDCLQKCSVIMCSVIMPFECSYLKND